MWVGEGKCNTSMTRVRYREPRQGVDLIVSRRGEVVANIVGILFNKPDGIVGRDLDTHHAIAAMWGDHLLKGLASWVEGGQIVSAHLPKPDSSLVINCQTHRLTV